MRNFTKIRTHLVRRLCILKIFVNNLSRILNETVMREETICRICFNLINDIDYHLKEAQEKTGTTLNTCVSTAKCCQLAFEYWMLENQKHLKTGFYSVRILNGFNRFCNLFREFATIDLHK